MIRTTAEPTLILTNHAKVFWPEHGYTKGDLLAYYREMAPIIVPYLKDRAQSIHRHPDGWNGKDFFQRISKGQPDWIETALVAAHEWKGNRPFVLCQNWPTLLWLVNFGCIELIPWNSRIGSLDCPDYMAIDLDPEAVPYAGVVEVAQMVRKVLDRFEVVSYPKTSGKRGLHVYVPLGARYFFGQVKMFSEIVCHLVHQSLPGLTSLTPERAKRQGKVYLDHTRNARGQSVAVAYCVRPFAGATVSAPLKWSEVGKRLDPSKFTMKTMPQRLEKVGDLWEGVLGQGIDLGRALENFKPSR
jgi:bifunctional non-homologous end joining protein LigD